MNKYIIMKYIRLSVDDRISESLSIPNQRAILDRHIDGLEIPNAEVIELVDNGYSGTNMERPAIQELLDLVRSGNVNCICVKDFSRFSRNAMDSGYFIEQVFPLYGVRFISVSDGFDSNDYKNDTGGIDVAFKFLMHEYYSKDLSVKVKSALRVKKLNGENASGNALYGYKTGLSKKLEPEPETAETVKLIFKLTIEGHSTKAIRNILFQKGCPTPKEWREMKRGKDITVNCRWHTDKINAILTDERYIGTYIAGRYKNKTVGAKNCTQTDKSEWIIIHDNHQAIISKEDYEQAQSNLRNRGLQADTDKIGSQTEELINKEGSEDVLTPLYGYIMNEKREVRINPKLAETIRLIFQMAIDGNSVLRISETLTQAGIPTRKEQSALDQGKKVSLGKAWSRDAVRCVLREIQYTGTAVFGRRMTTKKAEKGKQKPLSPHFSPRSEWRIVPNARPAIISEDDFNAVQCILNENPIDRRAENKRDFLLKGKAKCGSCGHTLTFDDGVGYPLFRCYHTIADPSADCHKFKVVIRDIDEVVLTVIRKKAEVLLNTANLGELTVKGDAVKELSDFEKRITECGEQHQQFYESFIMREIDRDEYLKLKEECSANMEMLSRQAAALKSEILTRSADESILAIAKKATGETLPHKELVYTLIDKVLVFPDKRIEIVWKIDDFATFRE